MGQRVLSTRIVVAITMLISFVTHMAGSAASNSAGLQDRWGYRITTTSPDALKLYEEAVVSYASLRGHLIDPLEKAIKADQSFLMAHIYLASIFLISTGVTRTNPTVQASFRAAKALVSKGLGTRRELLYLEALEKGLMHGDFRLSAQQWESVLADWPRDILACRLAHDAYIILGDVQEIRSSAARVLGRWLIESSNATKPPAAGEQDIRLVRAMWSFALEEAGDLQWAAAVAKEVLADNPSDVTALHALAHSHEMQSRAPEMLEAFKLYEGKWEQSEDLLRSHIAWHKGVMHAQMGEPDSALDLYDKYIVKDHGVNGGPATPLGMADAAAMLWRLTLRGVDVGERWQELRPFVKPYEGAHVTSFNDLHMTIALASSDLPAAHTQLDSMRRFISEGLPPVPELSDVFNSSSATATNQIVLASAGLAACEAMVAFVEGRYARAVELLEGSRHGWAPIGGSNAQRDILTLTLIEASVRNDTNLPLAKLLLGERSALKDPMDLDGTKQALESVIRRIHEVGSDVCISTD